MQLLFFLTVIQLCKFALTEVSKAHKCLQALIAEGASGEVRSFL